MSQLERDLGAGAARMNPNTGEPYATTSWAAVDLEPYKRGEAVIAPPKFLKRTDGKALIYPGRPHVFFGESESLKTFAALLACADVVAGGYTVAYVDLEGSEASFVERCRMAGVPEVAIGMTLRYIRPIEPLLGDARVDFWLHELEVLNPVLVVLDGVTELYSLQGWDINRAEDAARFQQTFAFRGLCASIAIDHTAKDAGRGSLGSQHKRAGLDGAEYQFEPMVAAGRGRRGFSRVSVSKDRHGFVREWANDLVGYLVVDSSPDVPPGGGVYLEPPQLSELVDPRDDAMDRVLEYLCGHSGASQRALRDGTSLKTARVSDALSALAAQGKVRNEGSASRGAWVVVEDAAP